MKMGKNGLHCPIGFANDTVLDNKQTKREREWEEEEEKTHPGEKWINQMAIKSCMHK